MINEKDIRIFIQSYAADYFKNGLTARFI